MEAAGGDVVRSVSLVVVIWFGCWWFEGGISVVMVIWFGCWWCGGGVSVVMVMWFGVLVVGVINCFFESEQFT